MAEGDCRFSGDACEVISASHFFRRPEACTRSPSRLSKTLTLSPEPRKRVVGWRMAYLRVRPPSLMSLPAEIPAPSGAKSLPSPGDMLGEKYRIVRASGRGGIGIVYEATHVRLEQRVAIKMLLPEVLGFPEIVTRFEREGRTAARIRSRHAVRVLDVDSTAAGMPYMVLEYLEGNDLGEELTKRGRIPLPEAVRYVLQACTAMDEAHRLGVVHRDLKPANLFLCFDGAERIVKVLDFGISKLDGEDARLTGTHMTMGTPVYMSPEQVRSAKEVDGRTDIWAMAVILFELVAGEAPFGRGTAASAFAAVVVDPTPPLFGRVPDVPVEVDAVLGRALEKEPAQRFPDIASFGHALAAASKQPVPSGLHKLGSRTGLAAESRFADAPPLADVRHRAHRSRRWHCGRHAGRWLLEEDRLATRSDPVRHGRAGRRNPRGNPRFARRICIRDDGPARAVLGPGRCPPSAEVASSRVGFAFALGSASDPHLRGAASFGGAGPRLRPLNRWLTAIGRRRW